MVQRQYSRMLRIAQLYKYLLSILMAICLFVLPSAMPRSKFMESGFLDVLVRCMIWSYFVFAYWSLSAALTNQIKGVKNLSFEMRRGLSTFMLFAVSAIGLGLLIWFLTRWSLLTFIPWLVKDITSLIAGLNGLIYTTLAFSRYFWLIEIK